MSKVNAKNKRENEEKNKKKRIKKTAASYAEVGGMFEVNVWKNYVKN